MPLMKQSRLSCYHEVLQLHPTQCDTLGMKEFHRSLGDVADWLRVSRCVLRFEWNMTHPKDASAVGQLDSAQ